MSALALAAAAEVTWSRFGSLRGVTIADVDVRFSDGHLVTLTATEDRGARRHPRPGAHPRAQPAERCRRRRAGHYPRVLDHHHRYGGRMTPPALADALEFVTVALAGLPEDPAELDDTELERIPAIQQGLARHCVAVVTAAGQLAVDLHEERIELEDAFERRDAIALAQQLGHQADELLGAYIAAAVRARGHRLEDLLEAATHTNGQEA